MYEPSRHIPLAPEPWNEAAAATAIREIATDAAQAFDPQRLWPAHPQDEGSEDGATSVYFGAAGVIWALDYLECAGAIERSHDHAAILPELIARNRAASAERSFHREIASLLFGDLSTLLLAMRLNPESNTADALFERAAANSADVGAAGIDAHLRIHARDDEGRAALAVALLRAGDPPHRRDRGKPMAARCGRETSTARNAAPHAASAARTSSFAALGTSRTSPNGLTSLGPAGEHLIVRAPMQNYPISSFDGEDSSTPSPASGER